MAGVKLTADEIDDVLYLVRVNEAQELDQFLTELAQKYGASQKNVLEACIEEDSGNTVLHYCSANGLTDLLRTLLNHLKQEFPRPLLNLRNASGNTPLHWAALNGHSDAAILLVEAGADIWIRNNAGNLAVFEAENAGKDALVAYLLKVGGTEKEKEETGETDEGMTSREMENGDMVMTAGDVSSESAITSDSDLVEGMRGKMEETGMDG